MERFAPNRWSRVTDIMLEKEAGNARCHQLCILAQSDFNQSKWIIIGICLTHHLEDNKIISHMQFGSQPGMQCQSAFLNKVLDHNIARLTHSSINREWCCWLLWPPCERFTPDVIGEIGFPSDIATVFRHNLGLCHSSNQNNLWHIWDHLW